MRLPFTKMQGVGNDFVVVEAAHLPTGSDSDADYARMARWLCDRKFGIGGDGLLVVLPSTVADVRMRMFNPDGTEDMCGNGLRCVVRYALDRGIVGQAEGVAESLDGLHRFDARGEEIEVEMAPPKFALNDIPVDRQTFPARCRDTVTNLGIFVSRQGGSIIVDAANTGSTHAVVWREQAPDDDLFLSWSPLIEAAKTFPERTSVLWAAAEEPNILRLRIWERGVGETMGCGTGACAAAALAHVRGYLDAETTRVISKGGTLTVRWSGEADAPIYLSGPAVTVFSGEIEV